ncbi:MAG TPA: hypothetical protein PLV73_03250, partial [Treponemataceae bacterium]|nr:hypothetical protein [Treponemataceae bacterium]
MACILLVLSGVLYGQNVPSVAVFSLDSREIGENITVSVNDLVFSFIRELRTYRIVDMRTDSLPLDL